MPTETIAEPPPPLEAPIPPEAAAELDKIALNVFNLHNDSPDAPPVEPAETSTAPQKAAAPESAPSAAATPLKAEPTGIPLDLLSTTGAKEEVGVKKEEVVEAPAETPVPPDIKSPAAIANWRELDKRYQEERRKTASLEAKLKETPPTDPNSQALIEQLRGQVTELSQAFEKVNVEANPRFQQQFNKPIERAKEGARSLLTTLGLDADLFDRTMALTGKARIEAMDDLAEAIKSPSVNGQLLNLVSQIDNLEAQKREVLSDVKGNAAKLQQEQRARYAVEVQEQEKRLSSILDQTITHLRDKSGFEFLRKSEAAGGEEHNKKVEGIIAMAGDILLRNTDETQAAAAAVLAAQAPHYRAAFLAERAARLEAQKELAAIKGAEPGLERGGNAIVYDDAPMTSVEDLLKFKPQRFGAG